MITNDRRVVFDVVARVAATAVAARVVDCVSAACIVVECAARAPRSTARTRRRSRRAGCLSLYGSRIRVRFNAIYRYVYPSPRWTRSARAIGSRAARRGSFIDV